MTKSIVKSNIFQMPKKTSRRMTATESLSLAQNKVFDAWESTGKKRVALAKEALANSQDCVDAHLVLAESSKELSQRIELCRNAVAAGERVLGMEWKTKYEGICWLAHETRPIMRAMAQLATELQADDQLDEALTIFRKLIELNPHDNQGIRHQFAGCLYEAECGEELEKLLSTFNDDPSASLKYIKALHLFRKTGPSEISEKALKDAFKANVYVPAYLSDIVEMPDEPPAYIRFKDHSEAIAYVLGQNYLWWDTEGAMEWLSEKLASDMRKAIDDQDLVEAVIKALRGEYEE